MSYNNKRDNQSSPVGSDRHETYQLSLKPVDSWFFRDSRPFEAQGMLHSVFPPYPPTIIGALRFKLAQRMGWGATRLSSWTEDIKTILGDGPIVLGDLRFQGPHISIQREKQRTTLYKVPLHILGETNFAQETRSDHWSPKTFLVPGDEVSCDLGKQTRLPTPQQETVGLNSGRSHWLTEAALLEVLSGKLVANSGECFLESDLWKTEYRVGLERHSGRHTALQGQLFSTNHIRFQDVYDLHLCVGVRGVPKPLQQKATELISLGGEGRMAELEVAEWPQLPIPEGLKNEIEEQKRLLFVLLTPMALPQGWQPNPGSQVPDLPGTTVVSACIDKPVLIGGWNSIERKPTPLRPYLPAGSVFFCEVEEDIDKATLLARHGECIGDLQAHGYGQIALGCWPQ